MSMMLRMAGTLGQRLEVDPALVGWWKFDGNLTDASGAGNHATVGTGSEAYTAGVYGQAWDNNATRLLKIDTITSADLDGTHSIVVWIKPSAIEASSFTRYRITSRMVGTSTRSTVGIDDSRISMSISGASPQIQSDPIEINKWYHVVAVFQNGNSVLYINGSPIGTSSDNILSGDATPLYVGGQATSAGTGRHFEGQIDNAMIFNRALSPSEIKYVYDTGRPIPKGAPL